MITISLYEECTIRCGSCRYYKVNADQPNVKSRCKRLDHKKIKLYTPSFAVYDCGRMNEIVCRDFEPSREKKYLYEHWRGYDRYYMDAPEEDLKRIKYGAIALFWNGDTETIWYVKASDFIEGRLLDEDCNIRWFKKQFYRRTQFGGYRLVTVFND